MNGNDSLNLSILTDGNITPKNRSITHLSVFPITSPFLKRRHTATKRFNSDHLPINVGTVINKSWCFKFFYVYVFLN